MDIWGWTVFFFGLVVAIAFAVLQMSDFRAARWFFLISAFIAIGGVFVFGLTTPLGTGTRLLICFLVFGTVGVLLSEAFRYVGKKEGALISPATNTTEQVSTVPESDFQIRRDWVAVAPHKTKTETVTAVTTMLSITNLGDPTGIEQWLLAVKMPGQDVPIGYEPMPVSGNLTLSAQGQEDTVLANQDIISSKTLNPIPTGGIVRGWLHFWIQRDFKTINIPGVVLEIWCRDVRGKEYKTVVEDQFPLLSSDYRVMPMPGVEIKKKPVRKPMAKRRQKKTEQATEKIAPQRQYFPLKVELADREPFVYETNEGGKRYKVFRAQVENPFRNAGLKYYIDGVETIEHRYEFPDFDRNGADDQQRSPTNNIPPGKMMVDLVKQSLSNKDEIRFCVPFHAGKRPERVTSIWCTFVATNEPNEPLVKGSVSFWLSVDEDSNLRIQSITPQI